jgi:hypothetical protein
MYLGEPDRVRLVMLRFRKICVALIAASLIGSSSVSSADTYSYVGNPFTTFVGDGVPNSNAYNAFAGKSVSAEFSVASPLGDDFIGIVNPTAFSFSGALIPLTNPSSYSFNIQTSDTGAIIGWLISIQMAFGPAALGISTSTQGDSSFSRGPGTMITASNSVPGTWSGPSTCNHCDPHVDAPAPLIGASVPGLAIGFGVLWLMRQRARRKID